MAALVGLTACSGSDPVDPGDEYPMSIDIFTPGNVFSPPVADIARGGRVNFRITESPDGDGHNALFGGQTGAPPDVPIVKDTTVSRTFNTAGSFEYFCTVHPGMVGEVIVH